MSSILEINGEVIRVRDVVHVKKVDMGLGSALEIRFHANPEPVHIIVDIDDIDLEYQMLLKHMKMDHFD